MGSSTHRRTSSKSALGARRASAAIAFTAAVGLLMSGLGTADAAPRKGKASGGVRTSPAVVAVQQYIDAVSKGDRVAAGRLDFACQYQMRAAAARASQHPPASDPIYRACWDEIEQAHAEAVDQQSQGMDAVWPGKGSLVFFTEDLTHYPPSAFVMERLGASPPGTGLKVDLVGTAPLPAASFPKRQGEGTSAASATRVTLRIGYRDALTSPVAYAPGAYQWTSTVKRPIKAIKAVTMSWVAITGLKKHGFPGDVAVLNLPVSRLGDPAGAVPFVTEAGGYVPNSTEWWEGNDVAGLLIAAVGRASLFPDLHNRVALLNRVLIIDPLQPDALTLLTRDLYETLLAAGAAAHAVSVTDPALAARFNELYWNTYAQTTRVDISLGMEMGGFTAPTPADYLYRVVPAMEKLAKVRPEDLENRIRLGIAYRWNNDQLAAIATHERVVNEVPATRNNLRARALIELAWSRIAKVAWNRILDDPGVKQAYKEAEEAFNLADRPVDKFAAAYTMAYSLLFTPDRDNQAVLARLTEARDWYFKVPGASLVSWRYLLSNDNLKGVVEADPTFQPLLAEDGVQGKG
ncbi:hypothetical protein [Candidatus Nitrospira bockiana]